MKLALFKQIKSQHLIVFLFQLLFFNSCSNKIIESCTSNNYLSNNNINPVNNFALVAMTLFGCISNTAKITWKK